MTYKKEIKLSPVILFCFNRFSHLTNCINSLKKNKLVKKTTIIIYSDGPKKKEDIIKVKKIRNYLNNLKGFHKKKLIFRKKNFGTKKNITLGINETFKKYDRAIIIEDDLVFSKYFLTFMNKCLEAYKKKNKIFHINGWSYPFMKNSNDDINFLGSMNCWGWATWKNRWKHLCLNEEKLLSSFSNKDVHLFDIYSSANHWSQLLRNKNKTLSSWAIYWHASIFLKNGLCIYPKFALVKNIGFDGSGRMSAKEKYNSVLKPNFNVFRVNFNIFKNIKLSNEEFKYYVKRKNFIGMIFVYLKKLYFWLF